MKVAPIILLLTISSSLLTPAYADEDHEALRECVYSFQYVDHLESAMCFQSLADDGSIIAHRHLAVHYLYGLGVFQDIEKGTWHLIYAANNGNVESQLSLAQHYESGVKHKGVVIFDKDTTKAIHWYKIAADNGSATAQHTLGNYYIKGVSVIKDVDYGVNLLEQSANSNFRRSQVALGELFSTGDCVEKDVYRAIYWYRMAAMQYDIDSQFALGRLYVEECGATHNLALGYMWLNIASEQNHRQAKIYRDRVAKEMTPAQIAEAEFLSSKYKNLIARRPLTPPM